MTDVVATPIVSTEAVKPTEEPIAVVEAPAVVDAAAAPVVEAAAAAEEPVAEVPAAVEAAVEAIVAETAAVEAAVAEVAAVEAAAEPVVAAAEVAAVEAAAEPVVAAAPELYLKAADGMQIYYNIWKPAADVTPIAVVLAIHGLGEHIHRYDHVFTKYAEAGIVVKGLDYRGHGRTLKKNLPISQPGFLGSFKLVFQDMLSVNAIEVEGVPAGLPTFVMGHSLGGLISLAFVLHNASKIPNFRGIISQAPAIRPATPIPGPIKFAAKLLGTSVIPKLSQANGLTYLDDPLNHGKITLRAARDIITYGEELTTRAKEFKHPVVMYFSKDDKMTGFAGGKEFMDKAGSTDKTFKEFSVVRHEPRSAPTPVPEVVAPVEEVTPAPAAAPEAVVETATTTTVETVTVAVVEKKEEVVAAVEEKKEEIVAAVEEKKEEVVAVVAAVEEKTVEAVAVVEEKTVETVAVVEEKTVETVTVVEEKTVEVVAAVEEKKEVA
ncbi:Alpha/Beta hydrolase protein [Chytridium lagenaria]|nr:Alpha/Beta hydrolase protein [Chytridium lagenaria]